MKELKTILIIIVILLLIVAGLYVNYLRNELIKERNTSQEKETLAKDLRQKITIKDGTITNQKRELDDLISWKKTYIPPEGKMELLVKENKELKDKIKPIIMENEKIRKELADVLDKIGKVKNPEEIEKLKKEAEELQKRLANSDKELKDTLNKLQGIETITQTVGFTLRIGTDILWNNAFYLGLDCKWFYFSRFSLTSGAVINLQDGKDICIKVIGISYHINGIVPQSWHWDNLEIELGVLYQFLNNQIKPSIGIRTNF